jgi:hypothetical protein
MSSFHHVSGFSYICNKVSTLHTELIIMYSIPIIETLYDLSSILSQCCPLLGHVWFLAILCQAKISLSQFSWYVFGFCHTLASNILFSVWPICHRVIVVANFCQSLASYFFTTLFVAATLLWLATLWLGKMWPGTKQAHSHARAS